MTEQTLADPDFRGLPDTLHECARKAYRLGLCVTHFNSGASRNSNNGTRIFRGHKHEYFDKNHLIQVRSLREVEVFLATYKAEKPIRDALDALLPLAHARAEDLSNLRQRSCWRAAFRPAQFSTSTLQCRCCMGSSRDRPQITRLVVNPETAIRQIPKGNSPWTTF